MAQQHHAGDSIKLCDLPDDCLVHCLSQLSMEERLCSVSMVSQRFRALCLAPQLVKVLDITIDMQTDRDAVLRSLQIWLAINAEHLITFGLEVLDDSDPMLIMGCLAACCAVAQLKKLTVNIGIDAQLPTMVWLMSTHSTLEELELYYSDGTGEQPNSSLTVDIPLQQFTALGALALYCSNLSFAPGCRLPSSLTCLNLSWLLQGLPSQILALPQLAELYLNHCECQLMGGVHPAAVSTSITRLDMHDSGIHGAILTALPELRHLKSLGTNAQSEEAITASLGSLQQLTHVSLEWECIIPPASFIYLTNLRRLKFHCYEIYFLEELPEVGGLPPPGAWSNGLQKLSIASSIAFRSLGTLQHMTALRHLRLDCCTADHSEPAAVWRGLLEAAAANQQLRRLDIISRRGAVLNMSDAVCGILLHLQRTHRHLTISCDDCTNYFEWDA